MGPGAILHEGPEKSAQADRRQVGDYRQIEDDLPTPRTTLAARYVRVLLTCWHCRHQADADLQGLIDGGRFIFFARRGEMVSNRREDHEISMLALHLLQNCMVYINALMLQQVLVQPQWSVKLTARDLRALTPLIWERVNPYGRFELDMEARLPIN